MFLTYISQVQCHAIGLLNMPLFMFELRTCPKSFQEWRYFYTDSSTCSHLTCWSPGLKCDRVIALQSEKVLCDLKVMLSSWACRIRASEENMNELYAQIRADKAFTVSFCPPLQFFIHHIKTCLTIMMETKGQCANYKKSIFSLELILLLFLESWSVFRRIFWKIWISKPLTVTFKLAFSFLFLDGKYGYASL